MTVLRLAQPSCRATLAQHHSQVKTSNMVEPPVLCIACALVKSMLLLLQGSSAKMDSNTTATITLAGFLAALVHLAHARAAAAVAPGGGPNTAAYTQLSSKLESLLHNCLQPNIYPDIARRVSCGSKLICAVSGHWMFCLHGMCLLLGCKVLYHQC